MTVHLLLERNVCHRSLLYHGTVGKTNSCNKIRKPFITSVPVAFMQLQKSLCTRTYFYIRAYDAALEGLNRARRLYTDAGPQGAEGIEHTRDPKGLVKAAAMRDGQRLKAEAVRVLR